MLMLLLFKKKFIRIVFQIETVLYFDAFYWWYNYSKSLSKRKRLRDWRKLYRSTAVMSMHAHWPLPLPAKGRTNIELREQFILAEGVSQSMSAFKPKTPSQQRSVSISSGSAGPITKVMLQTCHHITTSSTFCYDRLGHLTTAINRL